MNDTNKEHLNTIIAASVLTCDFSNLESECKALVNHGVDWLHLDIMDGNFVPNISFGFPVLASIRKKLPNAYFDCHCMIRDPNKYVEEFSKSGANQMCFHIESEIDSLEKLIYKIKENNMRVGVAVKPKTIIDHTILKFLDQKLIDMILVMSVEPGFGGQPFMEEVLEKVVSLRKNYPYLDIQIDGGVKIENIEKVAKAGANVIVSGTGIVNHKDPKYAVTYMRDIVETYKGCCSFNN